MPPARCWRLATAPSIPGIVFGDVKLELCGTALMNISESDLINKTFTRAIDGQSVTLLPAGDRWRGAHRQALSMVTEAREALAAAGVSEASAEQMLMPTARCLMRASLTAPVRMMAGAGGARIRCRRAFSAPSTPGKSSGNGSASCYESPRRMRQC